MENIHLLQKVWGRAKAFQGSSKSCPSLTRTFIKVCTLSWILPLEYTIEKALPFEKVCGGTGAFLKPLQRSPSLCRTYMMVLNSALGPSFGLYDSQGLCPLGRFAEGQRPLQNIAYPSKDLYEGLHWVLLWGFITTLFHTS